MNPLQAILEYAKKQILGMQLKNHPLISPLPDNPSQPSPTPSPMPTPMPQFGRVSYYLPTGGQTATGTDPVSGYTAAVSRQMLPQVPMGSLIKLPNGKVVRVEDLTADDILSTLDLYYGSQEEYQNAGYPGKGLERNVPYQIVGRDTTGLKYNYK